MAIDYLVDVEPLETAGKTDSEIADLLSAQTVTDMPNVQLRKYLHKNELWLVDPATGLRSQGSIGEAYAGLSDPNKALVRKLQVWVYDQESIETENDLDVALEFKTIIDGLVTLAIISAQNRAAIGQLAGGLKHGATTAGDIATVRNDYNASVSNNARIVLLEQLRAEIENTYINPAISDGVSDEATVRAAIKAGL